MSLSVSLDVRKKPDPIINTALKRKLFPYLEENGSFKDLKIDVESIYFITTRDASIDTCKVIMSYVRDMPRDGITDVNSELTWDEMSCTSRLRELVVTDMTAGVGGNTLLFGKYFKYVNAIELDYVRSCYLKHNIGVYNFDNINVYHGNCLDYVIRNDFLNQDIVFIDPPWGGKNYKSQDKITICLEEYSLEDICNHLIKHSLAKLIVLKLPKNYDFDVIKSMVKCPLHIHELKKMILVVIKNY
jgi:16S rRNA G966 N2-methylase RsmD